MHLEGSGPGSVNRMWGREEWEKKKNVAVGSGEKYPDSGWIWACVHVILNPFC